MTYQAYAEQLYLGARDMIKEGTPIAAQALLDIGRDALVAEGVSMEEVQRLFETAREHVTLDNLELELL